VNSANLSGEHFSARLLRCVDRRVLRAVRSSIVRSFFVNQALPVGKGVTEYMISFGESAEGQC